MPTPPTHSKTKHPYKNHTKTRDAKTIQANTNLSAVSLSPARPPRKDKTTRDAPWTRMYVTTIHAPAFQENKEGGREGGGKEKRGGEGKGRGREAGAGRPCVALKPRGKTKACPPT